ncbi:MAG: TIM barrel protein [Candidatus Micrarchaeota archaeon]
MVFGPGGVPIECKTGGMLDGVACVKKLGLGAIEWELVHGVNVKRESAEALGRKAKENGVRLSAHAPYYISLISHEHSKRKKSYEFILDTARALHYAGGGKVVFHPGFYGKFSAKEAFGEMKREMEFLVSEVKKEKLDVVLAPEVTGKVSQWGSLEELLKMHSQVKGLWLTIDFSHVHARGNGRLKTKKDFEKIFQAVRDCDKRLLDDLHVHFQGVKYSEKGELSHLELSYDSPPVKPFLELLVEFKCGGTVICESPVLEADALRMKKAYETLKGK